MFFKTLFDAYVTNSWKIRALTKTATSNIRDFADLVLASLIFNIAIVALVST